MNEDFDEVGDVGRWNNDLLLLFVKFLKFFLVFWTILAEVATLFFGIIVVEMMEPIFKIRCTNDLKMMIIYCIVYGGI